MDWQRIRDGHPPEESAGIFGLDCDETAMVSILSVPWDVTASGSRGTSLAPSKIVLASHELDLQDPAFGRPYEKGIRFLEADPDIENWQKECEAQDRDVECVNRLSRRVDAKVYEQAKRLLQTSPIVGLFGGDHSCPFGLIKALAEKHGTFSILHIDAHFDLRCAYEGYERSHASIFYNVLNELSDIKLIQVGIRDFCLPEKEYSEKHPQSIAFLDHKLMTWKAQGMSFHEITQKIINHLDEKVYISFDIDGLAPSNCPGTGTPVPGGLSFHEVNYLLESLKEKHQVIGFDLVECAAEDYDLNVAARLLYKMCGLAIHTHENNLT